MNVIKKKKNPPVFWLYLPPWAATIIICTRDMITSHLCIFMSPAVRPSQPYRKLDMHGIPPPPPCAQHTSLAAYEIFKSTSVLIIVCCAPESKTGSSSVSWHTYRILTPLLDPSSKTSAPVCCHLCISRLHGLGCGGFSWAPKHALTSSTFCLVWSSWRLSMNRMVSVDVLGGYCLVLNSEFAGV